MPDPGTHRDVDGGPAMHHLEQPGCRHDTGSPGEASVPRPDLTCMTPTRQRTIVRLIARGHTGREIGVEVDLNPAVVAEEVEHLRAALGLRTRLHIAALAMQQGPVPGDGDARQEGAAGWDGCSAPSRQNSGVVNDSSHAAVNGPEISKA